MRAIIEGLISLAIGGVAGFIIWGIFGNIALTILAAIIGFFIGNYITYKTIEQPSYMRSIGLDPHDKDARDDFFK